MFNGTQVAWKLTVHLKNLKYLNIQNYCEFSTRKNFCRSCKVLSNPAQNDWKTAQTVYEFTVNDVGGNPVSLEKYRGHVLLIVNVASQCGLSATNYKELVELHNQYHDSKGLRILAFPCNQFGGQEPGTNEEIVCFAKNKNAHFDFFDKIKVNGDDASPLWKFLKKEQGGTLGDMIKWNFTKFIVDKNGKVVERHGPTTDPSVSRNSCEEPP